MSAGRTTTGITARVVTVTRGEPAEWDATTVTVIGNFSTAVGAGLRVRTGLACDVALTRFGFWLICAYCGDEFDVGPDELWCVRCGCWTEWEMGDDEFGWEEGRRSVTALSALSCDVLVDEIVADSLWTVLCGLRDTLIREAGDVNPVPGLIG